MLKNLFISAFRQLKRQKGYSFITTITLFFGVLSSAALSVYILDQYSYDKVHKKGERIFRLGVNIQKGEENRFLATSAPAMGNGLKSEIPEIEDSTRVLYYNGTFSYKKRKLSKSLMFVDNSIFNIFTIDIVEGEKNPLSKPYTAVISRNFAKSLGSHPLGQILIFNDSINLKVTGIMENMPQNTQIKSDILVSFKTFEHKKLWGENSTETWKGYSF